MSAKSAMFVLSIAMFSLVSIVQTNPLTVQRSYGCPCPVSDWCEPIKNTNRKEVFAFTLSNNSTHWKKFDWAKITTLVMVGHINDSLMCMAHALNTSVSYIADINTDIKDPSLRRQWIQEQITLIQEHHLDGINFDYESAISYGDKDTRDAYTALVAETNTALKRLFPYSQVTVDVAWKRNIDQRYYDYAGLAKNSDFLFLMAYDEQSQIFGECIAMPNSGLTHASEGVQNYLSAGVPNHKLVLGLPWYGYIYPCVKLEQDTCFINHVPFRGVECSDAAGKEYSYSYITSLYDIASVQWNKTSFTPYFTFWNKGKSYQVQFDNPKSLAAKYQMAVALKLRGVGMWTIDYLDYEDSNKARKYRREMFGALPTF